MSAQQKLISNLRTTGLYPFIYSTKRARPGSILARAPSYMVLGAIFDSIYTRKSDGKNPFDDLNNSEDGAEMVPYESEASVAQAFENIRFSTHADVSVSYGGADFKVLLDVGFARQAALEVKPVGLKELSFPRLTTTSLAARFTQLARGDANDLGLDTELGQLVSDMKTRHPTFIFGPRPLDIALYVVVAGRLEITYYGKTESTQEIKAELQGIPSLPNMTIGGIVTVGAESSVKAIWDPPVPLPVLWYPWRYGYHPVSKTFVTARI